MVDLSNRLSGQFAARLFGDLGAEVILLRTRDGQRAGRVDLADAYTNWNKSLTVLEPDDPARHDLIASADLVVTTDGSTPPGASGVHLSITPHGLTGPLATVPGNQLTANARSGWAACNGLADEPPLQPTADGEGVRSAQEEGGGEEQAAGRQLAVRGTEDV